MRGPIEFAIDVLALLERRWQAWRVDDTTTEVLTPDGRIGRTRRADFRARRACIVRYEDGTLRSFRADTLRLVQR